MERCVGAYDERGVLVIVGVCVCALWGNRGRREMEGGEGGSEDRLEKAGLKAGLDGVGGGRGGWI